MKRLFAFMMALALVLSMTTTAFAANTGSITISNATKDHSYAPYLIFNATIVTDSNGKQGVSYTIKEDNQFFDDLFMGDHDNDPATPNQLVDNTYFNYNPTTGSVTKKEGVNDSELVAYLKKLIYIEHETTNADGTKTYTYELKSGLTAAAPAKIAADANSDGKVDNVVFEGLEYGYYLITSTLGTAVTINSNTPDVTVIDKNQEPAPDFEKKVWDDTTGTWVDENSASVGEKIQYKISFTATNYDGDKHIQYYQIHDEKGDGIWAEFNSIKVVVNGVELTKGYYLNQGGNNTDGWHYLGTGWGDDKPNDASRINEADWYLVHIGYDQFRITIPWMKNHTLTSNSNTAIEITKADTYKVNVPATPESKFESPVSVVVTYDAAIEPGISIGPNPTNKNRFNKAEASWTSEHETGHTPPDEVETKVYGIGILKDDGNTGENLAGAKFRVYKDAACTEPVYIIPTDIEGVYMVDSAGADIEKFSGTLKATAREHYANLYYEMYKATKTEAEARAYYKNEVLDPYLLNGVVMKDGVGNPVLDANGNEIKRDNYAVSQENGKLVILGLEKGTYYLLEVEAPAGYNALTTPVPLAAGTGTTSFEIFADQYGSVADIQTTDGVHVEHKYDVTHDVVHNSIGTVLPSTGGAGTVKMITIGTVIAIGFAVLLITNKKMTAYQD